MREEWQIFVLKNREIAIPKYRNFHSQCILYKLISGPAISINKVKSIYPATFEPQNINQSLFPSFQSFPLERVILQMKLYREKSRLAYNFLCMITDVFLRIQINDLYKVYHQ